MHLTGSQPHQWNDWQPAASPSCLVVSRGVMSICSTSLTSRSKTQH